MLERLRAWARVHTEEGRYSPIGIVFHWLMAGLILLQLAWGYYTDFLMPGGTKVQAYEVHAAIGLGILVLTFFRAAWRMIIPGPDNDGSGRGWQTALAHLTHVLFYVCFIALPVSGWIMWSALTEPGPLSLGGILPWPAVPLDGLEFETRATILHLAERTHHWLIILLLLLIPAHVGAALKHHFWDRHDVLRGMLPEIPDWQDPREDSQHRPREPRFPRETEAG